MALNHTGKLEDAHHTEAAEATRVELAGKVEEHEASLAELT